MAHGKTRRHQSCGKCGGSGKVDHPSYEGVRVSCPKCGGAGGKMVVEDEGCAIMFLTIGASAMMAAASASYGVF